MDNLLIIWFFEVYIDLLSYSFGYVLDLCSFLVNIDEMWNLGLLI